MRRSYSRGVAVGPPPARPAHGSSVPGPRWWRLLGDGTERREDSYGLTEAANARDGGPIAQSAKARADSRRGALVHELAPPEYLHGGKRRLFARFRSVSEPHSTLPLPSPHGSSSSCPQISARGRPPWRVEGGEKE
eukprot:scaffold5776_cov161-Prasinococcus_capsulatus_cf.AAC.1